MTVQRILVIEDDEHIRDLLTAVLRVDGHTVDTARDRTEAMSLMDQHAYTLILSDLRLPKLEGPELYRLMRQRSWGPQTPPAVIFLTRAIFTPDFASFLMRSASPVLTWPATPADISRVVSRVLAPA